VNIINKYIWDKWGVKGRDWEKVAAQLSDTILNFGSNFSARRDNFHRRPVGITRSWGSQRSYLEDLNDDRDDADDEY